MKQVGEHRRCGASTDQPLGLERLDVHLADALDLRVEQPAPGAAETVGLQGLLQHSGLQQNR